MNTRLQVEHPVTELRCSKGRLDLVALQLRVADGEPLGLTQDDIQLDGHAIEARVYAEDAFHGFLPQAGTASLVRWPARARVDAALESGQVVSTAYDPMLGKVIVHGPDRESARRALVDALDDTAILGFTTNVGFLRVLAASDEFRDATIDTAWLDTVTIGGGELPAPDDDLARIVAAWTQAMLVARTHGDRGHPFQSDGFRLGARRRRRRWSSSTGSSVDRAAARSTASRSRSSRPSGTSSASSVAGRRHQAVVTSTAHVVEVVLEGQRHVFHRPDLFADGATAAGDGTITAPMPGTVLAVNVAQGQEVAEGQRLGVLEAMKMELALKAPFAGTVTHVGASAPATRSRLGALPVRWWRSDDGRRAASERSPIYEVGPRDGLQNEKAVVPVEAKAEFIHRLLAAGLPVVEATSFVHPKWVPQLADAGELMAADRRLAQRRGPPGAGAQRARPRPGARARLSRTSRSSAAPPRPSRSATSTAASTSSSRCSSRPSTRARDAGLDVRAYVSMCFGDPWEGDVPIDQVVGVGKRLFDLGASQLCLGDTIGVGTAGPRHRPARRVQRGAGSPTTRSRCTSTTPTARRSPTRYAALQHGDHAPSTPAPAVSAAARTPRAPPATWPPRTWSGCCTGSASRPASTSTRWSRTSVWMAGVLGRPSPSRVVNALA